MNVSTYNNIRQLFVQNEDGEFLPFAVPGDHYGSGPAVAASGPNGELFVVGPSAQLLIDKKEAEERAAAAQAKIDSRKRVDELRTAWASLHSGDIEGSVYDSDSWMTLIQQFNRWFAMTAPAAAPSEPIDFTSWSEFDNFDDHEDSGPSFEEIEREAARKRIAVATVAQELRNEWEDSQPAAVSDDEVISFEKIKDAVSKALSKPESVQDESVRKYREQFRDEAIAKKAIADEEACQAIHDEIMASRVSSMFAEASFADMHFGGVFNCSTGSIDKSDQALIDCIPEMPVWMLALILSTTEEVSLLRDAIVADLERREAESE